jgi:histidinol dehydrogenase
VKKTQFSYFTEDALARVAEKVEFFANKEGLTAHAKSAIIRTLDKNKDN